MSDYVAFKSKQKQKARLLRKSAWWKRKCASGLCYYCGDKFLPNQLTMDHLIPIAKGGMSDRANIVPACKKCNNAKKSILTYEWSEHMEAQKADIEH